MSFPKYYVTYCVMDTDAGANPFGHSSLIFSRQDGPNSPIEVVDGVGFYSQPSTTTNPIIKGIKNLIKLNVDLQDGHGILRRELIRELDGDGLYGISFPLTHEQFVAISKNYEKMMKTELEVIEELNAVLIKKGIEPNGYTRFVEEKAEAEAESRPPRLKPFHITMKLTMDGLDSSDSYTCKDYALDLLSLHDVVPEEIRNQLMENKATSAFPIVTSPLYLPPIRLISTGTPEKVISKRSKEVFYNRVWGTNQLFWATPIHTSDETIQSEDPHYQILKDTLHKLKIIEARLRHKINTLESGKAPDKQYLDQLSTILNKVESLRLLFVNNQHNQDAKILDKHRLKTEFVLDIADAHLHFDTLDSSFMLRAFESISARQAVLGLLVIAISVAASILLTPLAVGGIVVGGLITTNELDAFYDEEEQFAKVASIGTV